MRKLTRKQRRAKAANKSLVGLLAASMIMSNLGASASMVYASSVENVEDVLVEDNIDTVNNAELTNNGDAIDESEVIASEEGASLEASSVEESIISSADETNSEELNTTIEDTLESSTAYTTVESSFEDDSTVENGETEKTESSDTESTEVEETELPDSEMEEESGEANTEESISEEVEIEETTEVVETDEEITEEFTEEETSVEETTEESLEETIAIATLVFHLLNGEEETVEYTIEDDIILSDDNEIGYRFLGWFADEDCTTSFDIFNISWEESSTYHLYGSYEKIGFVTFELNANGGDCKKDAIKVDVQGSHDVELPVCEKAGYYFDGWYTDISCTVPFNAEELTWDAETTISLYAGYTEIEYATMQFDLGIADDDINNVYTEVEDLLIEVPFDEFVDALPVATWEDHTFLGWFEDEECLIEFNYENYEWAADDVYTVYAGWLTEETQLIYKEIQKTVNGTTITITGNMPNDAQLNVVAEEISIQTENAITELSDNVSSLELADVVYAYDITIAYNGLKYEPNLFDEMVSVTFSFKSDELADVDTVEVFHVDDNTLDVEAIEVIDSTDSTVTIETDEFSQYIVVGNTTYNGKTTWSGSGDGMTYSGSQKTFTAPVKGIYKFELYGAQGQNYGSYLGGYGGSQTVYLQLDKNEMVNYIIGGQNGYNGGGSGTITSGGGATTLKLSDGSVVAVAAGGGGAGALGNGLAGGVTANTSLTSSSSGASSTNSNSAGGGGGYKGGTAGYATLHQHTGSEGKTSNGCYTLATQKTCTPKTKNSRSGSWSCYNCGQTMSIKIKTYYHPSSGCGSSATTDWMEGTCSNCGKGSSGGSYLREHNYTAYTLGCNKTTSTPEAQVNAYGGSNYVNTSNAKVLNYATSAGANGGNGYMTITLTEIDAATLYYYNFDSTPLGSTTVAVGTKATCPVSATPTRVATAQYSYTFKGWDCRETAGTVEALTNAQTVADVVNEDRSYIATYTAIPQTYTLTLDNEGATTEGTTSVMATYGAALNDITIPAKEGYIFAGYYTEKNGGGTQVYSAIGEAFVNSSFVQNTTLYAYWHLPFEISVQPSDTNVIYGYSFVQLKTDVSPNVYTACEYSYQWYISNSSDMRNAESVKDGDTSRLIVPLLDIGTYYLNCKIVATSAVNGQSVTKYTNPAMFTVDKGELNNALVTCENASVIYDGESHAVKAKVAVESNFTIYYSEKPLTADNYTSGSTSPLSYTDAGVYQVYVYIIDDNYEDFSGMITFTINKAEQRVYLSSKNVTYTGKAQTIDSVIVYGVKNNTLADADIVYTYYSDEDCTVKTGVSNGAAAEGGAPSKVGTYYVVANVLESDNYNAATTEIPAMFNILGTTVGYSVSEYRGIYDGEYHGLIVTVEDAERLMFYYSDSVELTEENYLTEGTTTPYEYVNAGVYQINYIVVNKLTSKLNTYESGTANIIILKDSFVIGEAGVSKPTVNLDNHTVECDQNYTWEYREYPSDDKFVTYVAGTELMPGDYEFRVQEDDNHSASDSIIITVPKYASRMTLDDLAAVIGGVNNISGLEVSMEYRNVNNTTWTVYEGTTGIYKDAPAGSYDVRFAETDLFEASIAKTVSVSDVNDFEKPTVNEDHTIKVDSRFDWEYRVASVDTEFVAYENGTVLMPGDYAFRVPATDKHSASKVVVVQVLKYDSIYTIADLSNVRGGVEKITGLVAGMEYSKHESNTWVAFTGINGTADNLSAGQYDVRFVEDEMHYASEAVIVTVTAKETKPSTPVSKPTDTDGDGIPDSEDNDIDGDFIPNEFDDDPYTPDYDIDGDGIPNDKDDDVDGDGIPNDRDDSPFLPDFDLDDDGITNDKDNDIDGDGIPNDKDPDPFTPNPDTDGDGIPNDKDDDWDNDFIPNDSDNDPFNPDYDLDNDGITNDNDEDIDGDGIPNDKDKNPYRPDVDTDKDGILDSNDGDMDGDGVPDSKDDDVDGDGIPNDSDNDPFNPNYDLDNDGITNDKDDDIDGDGIPNGSDNDPFNPNYDLDNDGITNDKDDDIDGDGIPNGSDNDPFNPNYDLDNDGIINTEDMDIDGDGIVNEKDDNPYVPNYDVDGDGIINSEDLYPYDPYNGSDMNGNGIPDALESTNVTIEDEDVSLSATIPTNFTETFKAGLEKLDPKEEATVVVTCVSLGSLAGFVLGAIAMFFMYPLVALRKKFRFFVEGNLVGKAKDILRVDIDVVLAKKNMIMNPDGSYRFGGLNADETYNLRVMNIKTKEVVAIVKVMPATKDSYAEVLTCADSVDIKCASVKNGIKVNIGVK